MTPEEYAVAQAAVTAGLGAYVSRVASLFTGSVLTIREWLDLLKYLFPEVQRRYAESAALGREFYDSQRLIHHPELPRNDRPLTELKFEWFVENMEPARKEMSQSDSPRTAVTKLALTAVREVEMAGRRQVIGAVNNDDEVTEKLKRDIAETRSDEPESRKVLGWARVATGRETCAWCLMLISRGPKYLEASSAGLNLDDTTVQDIYNEVGGDLVKFGEEIEEDMEKWHAGCDCLVVPVFDRQSWPGRAAQQQALQLWAEAGREADRLIAAGESRTKNVNKETINALRRRLERGEVQMINYAIAA